MPNSSDSLRFLVLGSDGQVGQSLVQLLESREIPYTAVSSQQLSLVKDVGGVILDASLCHFVINVLFEEPPKGASVELDVWPTLASDIAKACHKAGKALIQLSSGLVFSGKSARAYVETDAMDATDELGQTYIEIEKITQEKNDKTILLRTSWLFSEQSNNFLTHLVGAAIRQESLRVSGNLRGCPTYSLTAAKVIVAMAEQVDCGAEPDLWGVYQYADSDACSMHTFAKTVITVVKSMAEVRVENLEEGDSPDMIDAVNQPENYEMACKKILSTFGIKQRPWRRSIHDVLKEKFSTPA